MHLQDKRGTLGDASVEGSSPLVKLLTPLTKQFPRLQMKERKVNAMVMLFLLDCPIDNAKIL